MSNYLVIDGDGLNFSEKFGLNNVVPVEVCQIKGSGAATILNKKICIFGDEKSVSIKATYYSEVYPTPGNGTLTILSLAADQQATFVTAETPAIITGSQFTAKFTVTTPATNPGGTADSTPFSMGTGAFINSQDFVTAG